MPWPNSSDFFSICTRLQVSELIGIKTVINEFLAFETLGNLIKIRDENSALLKTLPGNYTLQYLKERRNELGKKRID